MTEGTAGETGGAVANPERVRLPIQDRPSRKQSRLDKMTAEWDAVHEKGSE